MKCCTNPESLTHLRLLLQLTEEMWDFCVFAKISTLSGTECMISNSSEQLEGNVQASRALFME